MYPCVGFLLCLRHLRKYVRLRRRSLTTPTTLYIYGEAIKPIERELPMTPTAAIIIIGTALIIPFLPVIFDAIVSLLTD